MSTINLNAMGIQELQVAISQGTATEQEVFDLLESRISKRLTAGKNLLLPVVQYRNILAGKLGKATMPQPNYKSARSIDQVIDEVSSWDKTKIIALIAALAPMTN